MFCGKGLVGRAALVAAAVAMMLAAAAPRAGAMEAGGALRSSGCSVSPPEALPHSIVVDDVQRDLIVVPGQQAAVGEPHDLVIAFHGRTNSNADVRAYFDLERHAQRPTLFVYPAGLPVGDGARGWSDGGASPAEPRDFALFDAIILRLARLYCVDLGRVFAVGHSLGASFVNALACSRGDRLRGIATVAGGGGSTVIGCSGPVAALILHNPRDPVVAISDAAAVRDRLIRSNGLAAGAVPGPSAELGCVRYGGAAAPDPVVWCEHQRDLTWRGRYYPHQWPRESGALIMSFFAALP